MSWWGKVIGGAFGFALVGPLGALLGAAIGHSFDKGLKGLEGFQGAAQGPDQERIQAAFFTATFSVMGHLAKADGRVSESEIQAARNIMDRIQLDQEQRRAAINLFNKGKEADFDFEEVLHQFKKEVGRRTNLLQMFMEIQLGTALADGELHPEEHRILMGIASILGFHQRQFEQLLAMATAQQRFSSSTEHRVDDGKQLADAYKLLGVEKSASDSEVKRAYRKLIAQHHPDKLVSKGLPEEMMKIATDKTREIKDAYDLIKQNRKQ